MNRTRQIIAALLLAAVPLDAQVARVAAPSLVPAAVVPAAVFAAPVLAAPPLSAPSALPLPAAAAFAASAAAVEVPGAAPALAAAAPPAAADGPRRGNPSSSRAAPDAANAAVGARVFDGSRDLVTRSGSVFAPSRTAQPAVSGLAFVRVQPAPAAPVKPVPGTAGLSGPALLNQVARVAARGHAPQTYHDASSYLFSTADNHTLNGVRGVADAYSGVFIPGTSTEGRDYAEEDHKTPDGRSLPQEMNVEHGFPQSFFKKLLPMRADIHQLMATFSYPNEMRSNLPFGVASAPIDYSNEAGAKRGGGVFEPPDFTKGRVARLMLYFYARYKDEPFLKTRRAAAFWNSQVDTFLDWNRRFPPTVEESRRNDHGQEFQGNRNPFVDDSGLADRIGAEALRSAFQPKSVKEAEPKGPARRAGEPGKGKKRQARAPRSDKPRKGAKRSNPRRKPRGAGRYSGRS